MQNQQFRVEQQQSQTLALGFWHRQLSTLLRLNTAALGDYIKAQADRNPCLEIEAGGISYGTEDVEDFIQYLPDRAVADFRRELALQLSLSPGAVGKLEQYLIASLDAHGYCRENLRESAELFALSLTAAKQALRRIQALEPAGIGARSLRECFLLQLARQGRQGCDGWVLLLEAFAPLSKGNDAAVLAQLEWSAARLARARKELAGLRPYPVEAAEDTAVPVIPDAEILRDESGRFTVRLLEHALPKLTVSPAYLESLAVGGSGKRFSQDGVFYARRFLYCLEQRNQTLLQVLLYAVERQQAFLLGGPRQVCLLREAAAQLKLHPSTITHAAHGKYLLWGRRVLPAKELFARPAFGGCSPDELQRELAALIGQEDSHQPYSDQRLSELLSEQFGCPVSRRTIAKYRLQFGFATAKERRNR